MIDPVTLKAARRLQISKDLSLLANAWRDEQLGVILSTPVEDGRRQIVRTVSKVHAIEEFVEFVNQVAQEADHG